MYGYVKHGFFTPNAAWSGRGSIKGFYIIIKVKVILKCNPAEKNKV
jgi:hypothetical protein